MIESGWYMCPTVLSGRVFGINHTPNNYWVTFLEVLIYSQEAIQLQALETRIIAGN